MIHVYDSHVLYCLRCISLLHTRVTFSRYTFASHCYLIFAPCMFTLSLYAQLVSCEMFHVPGVRYMFYVTMFTVHCHGTLLPYNIDGTKFGVQTLRCSFYGTNVTIQIFQYKSYHTNLTILILQYLSYTTNLTIKKKNVQTVGATELLEIVAQEPVCVQDDTLHGVSQSLLIVALLRC